MGSEPCSRASISKTVELTSSTETFGTSSTACPRLLLSSVSLFLRIHFLLLSEIWTLSDGDGDGGLAGFLIGTTACCGVGNYGGGDRCLTPLMVCRNPPDYVWWDEYHPSHRANFLIARQIWSGVDPSTTTNTSAAPSNVTYSFLTVQQLVNVQLESD